MRAKICRRYEEDQVKGDFELYDTETEELEFVCKTLELGWLDNETNISCIPEGTYDVIARTSKKYGKHLHVTDVEGRGKILIHWGNFAGSDNPRSGHPDIRGCILVGKSYGDINKKKDGIDEILTSKPTFNALMEVAPDGFVLEVTQ